MVLRGGNGGVPLQGLWKTRCIATIVIVYIV